MSPVCVSIVAFSWIFLHFSQSQIYCAIHELLSAFLSSGFWTVLVFFCVCFIPFFFSFFFLGGDLNFHKFFA